MLCDTSKREIEVVPGSISEYEGETECIGRVLRYDIERIDDISPALTHLAPCLIEDESMEIYLPEWRLSSELISHEKHTDDPEEEDIVSSLEDVCRIILLEERSWIIDRIVEHRKRPECRREPGIQYIIISLHREF